MSHTVEPTPAIKAHVAAEVGRPTEQQAQHPNDYYYRPGMPLRPAPPRASPSTDWFEMRKRLFSDWITVREVPIPTRQSQLLNDHLWEGDEAVDAVVGLSRRIGPAVFRDMLDKVLDTGIESLPDAPAELTRLIEDMLRVPDWFDADVYERGRRLLIDCSPIGRMGGTITNVVMTAYGEAVGSATGATGRFQRTPFRRTLETADFFRKVLQEGGLDRNSESFKTTVRVRYMHGQVRAALRAKWGPESFARNGNPISNSDMALGVPSYAAVNLLIDASFGRKFTESDLDAVTMFWGYHAYRFGVSEAIIPKNGIEAVKLFDQTLATYGQPSEWADELASSLISFTQGAMTSGGSTLAKLVGRKVMFPLYLGMVVNIGQKPVGLRATSFFGRDEKQLRRLEKFAVLWARAIVGRARLRDLIPGREKRMRTRAMQGDPRSEESFRGLQHLAAQHEVHAATFDGHDSSTAASVESRTRA
jgi:hypothetical protein